MLGAVELDDQDREAVEMHPEAAGGRGPVAVDEELLGKVQVGLAGHSQLTEGVVTTLDGLEADREAGVEQGEGLLGLDLDLSVVTPGVVVLRLDGQVGVVLEHVAQGVDVELPATELSRAPGNVQRPLLPHR